MATKYQISLTTEERGELDSIVKKGKNAARVILLALVLLFCDISPEGRGKKTNVEISRELNISERTIESLKKRFVEGGISYALQRKPKTFNPKTIKFDGAFEAKLIALACSPPPEGRVRWTVRLLADKLVELGIATEGISHMSVQRALKKTKLVLTSKNMTKFHQRATPIS
ncbi:MAG: helix-turn-helix domain-containing protein [Deltaproteobacteria bacterium]|jgi:transposase|nr:helix-turn-helix domain-containing protein [Deltaproteobacteria bacterium]